MSKNITRSVVLPTVAYYWNGDRVTKESAFRLISDVADRQGYELDNWSTAWAHAGRSEESRDFLCEISGYALEIVVH